MAYRKRPCRAINRACRQKTVQLTAIFFPSHLSDDAEDDDDDLDEKINGGAAEQLPSMPGDHLDDLQVDLDPLESVGDLLVFFMSCDRSL